MTTAWRANMDACQRAIVEKGGFNWQLFHSIHTPSREAGKCASFLREASTTASVFQSKAVQVDLTYKFNTDYSGGNLTNFDMDLALFLAARGPYAWLGYGWMGCGCGWEHEGKMPCDIYQRPSALGVDYGAPLGMVKEETGSANVFVREWSKATVTVDCNEYTSRIVMKKTY